MKKPILSQKLLKIKINRIHKQMQTKKFIVKKLLLYYEQTIEMDEAQYKKIVYKVLNEILVSSS